MAGMCMFLFCVAVLLLKVNAQDWAGQGNPGFTPMGMNGIGYNPMVAGQTQAAAGQQWQAGNDRGENVNMQRVPLALGIQRFPGMLTGGYAGGYAGGFPGGLQGGYPGSFPGGFPRGFPGVFGRNPMLQNDFMQERRSNMFGDMAMAAAITGTDMWMM